MKVERITDSNGNDVAGNPNHLANLNPLRYRSYFYDTETGFYWLNTRYYNPVVGRFLNADGALYNGIIRNLFSYCFNNPLNFCDCYGDCAHNPYKTCDPCYRAYLADDVVDEDQYHNRDIISAPTSFAPESDEDYICILDGFGYGIDFVKIVYEYAGEQAGILGTDLVLNKWEKELAKTVSTRLTALGFLGTAANVLTTIANLEEPVREAVEALKNGGGVDDVASSLLTKFTYSI